MIALLATLLAVVSAPYAPVSYACDGSTVAYTVNFPYLTQTDLFVTSTTAGGAVTNLVLTTDYSLNVSSTTTTAVLTLQAGSRCPNLSTLKIARNMSITQPQVFNQQTAFNPQIVGAVADRCVMQEQQIQAQFAGTQNVNFGGLNTFTATQTFAPGAGSDAIVAAATGTGRAIVATSVSGNTITATASTTGVAGQFTGNANDGPIQIVGQASDPAAPANGEMWLNTTQQAAKIRINGVSNILSGNPMLGANTAAGQVLASGASTIIVFGTVERDSDSTYASGTGRYTVPTGKGGDYLITSAIMWNANPGANCVMEIFKNAVGVKTIAMQTLVALETFPITAILNLAPGDVIDIRATQTSGGAVALSATAARNYLAIKRLSD